MVEVTQILVGFGALVAFLTEFSCLRQQQRPGTSAPAATTCDTEWTLVPLRA